MKHLNTNTTKTISYSKYIFTFLILKPVSSRCLSHRFFSKHIVSSLTSQDLRNQSLLSCQQDHVTQGCHLFQDFLEHQEYQGYLDNHSSADKSNREITINDSSHIDDFFMIYQASLCNNTLPLLDSNTFFIYCCYT